MNLNPIQENQEPEYPPIREYFWRRPCFKKKLAITLASVMTLGVGVASAMIVADRIKNPYRYDISVSSGYMNNPRPPPLPPTGTTPAAGTSSSAATGTTAQAGNTTTDLTEKE